MRKIIEIDEDKCNGCSKCIGICAEAALELVNGKARLIKDFYCDGMGACLDVCPVNALRIVEKDTDEYDPQKTYEYVKKIRSEEAAQKIHKFEKVKKTDKELSIKPEDIKCSCPSSMMKDFSKEEKGLDMQKVSFATTTSQLRQWPIQLKLIMPQATYFYNSDLLIAADCVPFANPNFHTQLLKGKSLCVLCPKLDSASEEYITKLSEIFRTQNIKSITIARMEVPCCSGIEYIVKQALTRAKVKIEVKTKVTSIRGTSL